MTTTNTSRLVRVVIDRETNDDGDRIYTVTPFYRLRTGETVSVPDTRGWRTKAGAKAEAERLAGGAFDW
jgi:hypothetical protein